LAKWLFNGRISRTFLYIQPPYLRRITTLNQCFTYRELGDKVFRPKFLMSDN
jgi:hypothetical protein